MSLRVFCRGNIPRGLAAGIKSPGMKPDRDTPRSCRGEGGRLHWPKWPQLPPDWKALLRPDRLVHAAILLAIISISCWLMFGTFGYRDGTFLFKAKVWSDFGSHIQMIRSFSFGDNVPPQYPTYPGPRMSYHFLLFFLVGMLERLGVNMALALNVLSAAGFALFLWLIYYLARVFFNAVAAGVLAIVLVLFNGTLDWWIFFQKHPLNFQGFREMVTAKNFVSFGPWDGIISAFWTLNIYTNQRHLALSYAAAVLLLLPLVRYTLQDRTPSRRVFVYTMLAAPFLPLLNKVIVAVVAIYALVWMLFYPRTIKRFAWFYFLVFAAGLPALLYLRGETANLPAWQPGFLANPRTWTGWVTYWWYNLGLYCFVIPVVYVWAGKPVRAWMTAALVLFVLVNMFRFSTFNFDNHKFLNFFIVSIQLAAAGWLTALWRRSAAAKVLVVPLVLGLTFSGLIDLFPLINDAQLTLKDWPKSEAISWVARETPPDAVFLTPNGFYNPASLAGRKLYVGYTFFPWSMGYPVYAREKKVIPLFYPETTQAEICSALSAWGVRYILIAPGPGDWPERVDAQQSRFVTRWAPAFVSDDNVKIYDARDQCAVPG